MRHLLLLLCFLGFSCTGKMSEIPAPNQPQISVPTPPPPSGSGKSFLALGDSYTIGEGVATAERWPQQLVSLAQQQGLALQAPTYIARTGWTTAELQAAIADANPAASYDLVSLLIGVNNQYRGQTVALYRVELRELLRTAVRLTGGRAGRVVVLSIPDWGQSPAARQQGRDPAVVGSEIDQFNVVAQDECRQANVAYVDITPLTRAAAGNATQFAPDGLHYSGPQMRLWAERALPVVNTLLQ